MIDPKRLQEVRHLRATGIGRMLLLARKDFLLRVHSKRQHPDTPPLPPSFVGLLPYIDIDGTRNTVLAQRAGVSKQAVGKIVRELEARGLLARCPDPTDRRAFLVTFTEQGLERLIDTHNAISEVEAEYEALIGPEKMADLRDALRLLVYPG